MLQMIYIIVVHCRSLMRLDHRLRGGVIIVDYVVVD